MFKCARIRVFDLASGHKIIVPHPDILESKWDVAIWGLHMVSTPPSAYIRGTDILVKVSDCLS